MTTTPYRMRETDEHGHSEVSRARIAELEAAAAAMVRAWASLAARNEASMPVWRDKLSPDMLAGMDEDRAAGFAAARRLRDLGVRPEVCLTRDHPVHNPAIGVQNLRLDDLPKALETA